MKGWISRYDYAGMTNIEKYMGRELHNQDNCWFLAKIFLFALVILIGYLILNGDLNLTGAARFYNYLK